MLVNNIIKTAFAFNKIVMMLMVIALSACAGDDTKPDSDPEAETTEKTESKPEDEKPEDEAAKKPKPEPKPEVVKEEKPTEVVAETKKVSLNFVPSNNLNTNRKKPYPLRVVVYQLKSNLNFNAYGFRAIIDKEQQSLKGDVLAKEEWRFKPKDSPVTYVLDKINEETKYIGFVAYYMDINNAKWQAIYELNEKNNQDITILLNSKKITLQK